MSPDLAKDVSKRLEGNVPGFEYIQPRDGVDLDSHREAKYIKTKQGALVNV
jgi:hypothetical protein